MPLLPLTSAPLFGSSRNKPLPVAVRLSIKFQYSAFKYTADCDPRTSAALHPTNSDDAAGEMRSKIIVIVGFTPRQNHRHHTFYLGARALRCREKSRRGGGGVAVSRKWQMQ